jgi:hypothetical protein
VLLPCRAGILPADSVVGRASCPPPFPRPPFLAECLPLLSVLPLRRRSPIIGGMPQRNSAPGAAPPAASPVSGTILPGKPWFFVLMLAIMTFAAYQPVWHAGFIWDDDDHLTANPAMTAPDGLRMIWSSLAVSRYYPLTLTTFWVQRRLWGLNPMPYHLVNIALHAINGVLVFFVLRRLRVPGAWFAAMLWTLHPVNVESVAWITELKNTQSGLFFLVWPCGVFSTSETTADEPPLVRSLALRVRGWRRCSASHPR